MPVNQANSERHPFVSVIVPTYNAERYIDDIMNSLLSQTFSNAEFIFVNDGSKDNTLALLHQWAAKDNRIIIVDKPNGGSSSARNAGLNIAKGEYVFFHDCDDYSFPDMLETMYREVEGRDILIAGWLKTPDRNKAHTIARKSTVTEKIVANNMNELLERQPHTRWIGALWRCLFKREIIEQHKIRFRFKNVNHEDELFLYECITYINSAVYIDYQGYVYINNPGSISKIHKYNVNTEWMIKAEEVFKHCLSRLDPEGVTHLPILFDHMMCVEGTSYVTTGYHSDSWMPFKERIARWRYLHNSVHFQSAGANTKNKYERIIWFISRYHLYYLADPFLLILTRFHDK
ncbi:MAG: glycosyltransferase [Prevotella sp.]|nr:glycosyltransferase [Prevotella sp.]MCF0208093.1 glycosyltransferase [Bacteroidaceae bacterium]